MNNKNKIAILSSYHGCYCLSANRLPGPGETVMGHTYEVTAGGKGGSQAIVAAFLGGNVATFGRVGADEFGRRAMEEYDSININREQMIMDDTVSTGIAGIYIDDQGENAIIIVQGANGKVSREDVDRAAQAIYKDAYIASFQLEVTTDTVEYAIEKAHSMGLITVLDPAPVIDFNPKIYKYLDYIKPNEHEASVYSGIEVTDFDSAVKAGNWFLDQGVKQGVIITMGKEGCALITREESKFFKAPYVEAIDSTGSGDAFTGALLMGLAEEWSIDDAILYANCAGAVMATKGEEGTIFECFPQKEETDALHKEYLKTL